MKVHLPLAFHRRRGLVARFTGPAALRLGTSACRAAALWVVSAVLHAQPTPPWPQGDPVAPASAARLTPRPTLDATGRAASAAAAAAASAAARLVPPVVAPAAPPAVALPIPSPPVPGQAPLPRGWPADLDWVPDAWPPVMARFPDPPDAISRWGLPALTPGRVLPTSQDELDRWLADTVPLAPVGTRVDLRTIGRSQLGVAIQALHFSRGPGRPLVLLVGQQHGNEPAGAEALLVLARDLAQGALGQVLDQLDVLLLPRLNVDGAAWAHRLSAGGVDINRDHLLLRTPEARALASLVRTQRPVLVVDAHEYSASGRMLRKFGALPRHDMLLQYAMSPNLPAALGEASAAWFMQPVQEALAAAGHSSAWYHTNSPLADDLSLRMGSPTPDILRNAYGLRHGVSLLLESRGIGLGPLHLARRVQSHLLVLRTALTQAARHAPELLALQARADAEVRSAACTGVAVVLAGLTPQRLQWPMLDPLTGADRLVPVDWHSALTLQPLRQRARPCGYWLAADQQRAAARLLLLGVQVQRLAMDARLKTEAWRPMAQGVVAADTPVPDPDEPGGAAAASGGQAGHSAQRGHADGATPVRPLPAQGPLALLVTLQAEALDAPKGSFYVPLDQPLANLVLAAMEPDTPDSFMANRVISRLDAARRVMARPGTPVVP